MKNLNSFKNPLKFIIYGTLILSILIFILYLMVRWMSFQDNNGVLDKDVAQAIAMEIKTFGLSTFTFLKPFLQLALLLIIVDWILRKFGVEYKSGFKKISWNTQTIMGLIIISAFTLSALSGIGVTHLKDIALVVVGFYFGTQKRVIEYESEGKKVKIEEEHENPINKTEGKEQEE